MRRTVTCILALACCIFAQAQHLDNDIVLKNDKVELRFGGSPNSYFFRYFYFDGVNILPSSGSNTYPWEITLLGPGGENPVLQPRFANYKGGKVEESDGRTVASFTWNLILEGKEWPLTMHISLSSDDYAPHWGIEADVPEGWTVTKMDYPRISVKRLEGDVKGILPFGYGAEYAMPTSGQLQSRYPSCTGVMQLVMMHNGAKTVSLTCDDRSGSNKFLGMKGEGGDVVFYQSAVTSYAWSDKGHFELPWTATLTYTPQCWEEAVREVYRPFTYECQWGSTPLAERRIAGWIKNADLWLRPSGVEERELDALYKALDYYGKGVGLHWYYWHQHPFDTNYPDYLPAKQGFAEAVKKSRSMGAYVTPYINGRLWDTANHTYRELHGSEASCRKADGTLYTEVYSSKVLNTVTCPSSPIWQDVMYDVNRRIITELGTDGVYMDQVGCAASEPCYAENHSHAKGGGSWWPDSYRVMLSKIRQDLYSDRLALTTEENVECYMDLFDMMLVVNSPHSAGIRMVPLFPVVYSDRCLYSGFTYVPWKLNDGSFNYLTMKSLLWGSQLGWVNPEMLMRGENRTEQEFLKHMAAFRKSNHDVFFGGQFIRELAPEGDNPVIDIPGYQKSNVVMAAEWLSVKGRRAYIIANMGNEARKVILPNGREVEVKAYSAVRVNTK